MKRASEIRASAVIFYLSSPIVTWCATAIIIRGSVDRHKIAAEVLFKYTPSLQVLVLEAGLDLPQLPEKLMQAVLTPAAHNQLHKTPVAWELKTTPQVSLSRSPYPGNADHLGSTQKGKSRWPRVKLPPGQDDRWL